MGKVILEAQNKDRKTEKSIPTQVAIVYAASNVSLMGVHNINPLSTTATNSAVSLDAEMKRLIASIWNYIVQEKLHEPISPNEEFG